MAFGEGDPLGGCCPTAGGRGLCEGERPPPPRCLERMEQIWDGGCQGALVGVIEGLGGGAAPRGHWCLHCPPQHPLPRGWGTLRVSLLPPTRAPAPGAGGVSRGSPIPPHLQPCPGVTPSRPTAPFPHFHGTTCGGGTHDSAVPAGFPSGGGTAGGQRAGTGGPRRLPGSNERPGSSGTGAGAGSVSRSLPERWEQLCQPSACHNPAGMPPGRICPCLGWGVGGRQLSGVVSPQRAQRPR